MDCLICVEKNVMSLPCKICKQNLCIKCDIKTRSCPFCRKKMEKWIDKFVSFNEEQKDTFLSEYRKTFIKTVKQTEYHKKLISIYLLEDKIPVPVSQEQAIDIITLFMDFLLVSIQKKFSSQTLKWLFHSILNLDKYFLDMFEDDDEEHYIIKTWNINIYLNFLMSFLIDKIKRKKSLVFKNRPIYKKISPFQNKRNVIFQP